MTSQSESRKRVEVLCLTYGEPPETDFLPQFKYSLSILNRLTRRVAPIPKFVTPLIAARRARERKKTFREINYRSPLEDISKRQVAKLSEILQKKQPDVKFNVRLVCEFREPYIWTFLKKMKADPPDELILLPMYFAESDFTTGISRTDLANFYKQHGDAPRLPKPKYVGGFGYDPRFGKMMADFVWRHCREAGWSEEKCKGADLILGAHGTVITLPPEINSGARETAKFCAAIRSHLMPRFHRVRVGWLNHELGGKWTTPEVGEAGEAAWQDGIRNLVYFPYGFMADNAESQVEGRDALGDFDWEDLLYLPCPNDDPALMELLADCVLERMEQEGEDWENIDPEPEMQTEDKQTPAPKGREGVLNFSGRTLALLACAFWLLVGAWLTARGLRLGLGLESAAQIGLVALAAVGIGYVKGRQVLARMARKNLERLRRLPQPSPVYRMFSGKTWLVIAFFATLGMSLRFAPLPEGLLACVLLGVGFSLLLGGATYLIHLRPAAAIDAKTGLSVKDVK